MALLESGGKDAKPRRNACVSKSPRVAGANFRDLLRTHDAGYRSGTGRPTRAGGPRSISDRYPVIEGLPTLGS
jgi:hypothetical protein